MRFLLIAIVSLTIGGLSANAQAPGKCVDGKMIEDDSDTGVSCFVTRSGKTIRLFRTQGSNQNVKQVDTEEKAVCEDGSVMRMTPTENNCISGEDFKIGREAPSRVIHVSEQLAQKSVITIFAGGRRRSQ